MPGAPGVPKTMTDAAREQRRAASKKSRPSRARLSTEEEVRRAEAVKIGRALDYRTMVQAQTAAAIASGLLERMNGELASDMPDWELVERLTRIYRNMEPDRLREGVQDRFGSPRRSMHDVQAQGSLGKLFAAIPPAWAEAPEAKHDPNAAPAPGNADGDARG